MRIAPNVGLWISIGDNAIHGHRLDCLGGFVARHSAEGRAHAWRCCVTEWSVTVLSRLAGAWFGRILTSG